MADYIEREALQARLERKKSSPAKKQYTEGWNDAVLMFKSMVHSEKAADVAPVRHGYWIENQPYTIKHKNITMSGNAPQCSECGYISFGGFENKTRYCPNCGAKMDKEETEC